MTKKITALAAVALAAVAIAGTYAFAQGRPGMGHGQMGNMGHGKMGHMGNAGDPTARLGALKTEIGVRPEQATAWETYAKVVTDVAAERRSVRESMDHDAVHKMEPKDRRAFRESMQGQRDASITKVRSAAEALLAQLDDAQKEKARQTLPGLIASGQGEGMRHGKMGDHGQGHSNGQGMGPQNKQ